jgi:hypothetical protein
MISFRSAVTVRRKIPLNGLVSSSFEEGIFSDANSVPTNYRPFIGKGLQCQVPL